MEYLIMLLTTFIVLVIIFFFGYAVATKHSYERQKIDQYNRESLDLLLNGTFSQQSQHVRDFNFEVENLPRITVEQALDAHRRLKAERAYQRDKKADERKRRKTQ